MLESNLYGTLDMVPGFFHSPQLLEITKYLKKTVDIPTPKPYESSFYLCQGGSNLYCYNQIIKSPVNTRQIPLRPYLIHKAFPIHKRLARQWNDKINENDTIRKLCLISCHLHPAIDCGVRILGFEFFLKMVLQTLKSIGC